MDCLGLYWLFMDDLVFWKLSSSLSRRFYYVCWRIRCLFYSGPHHIWCIGHYSLTYLGISVQQISCAETDRARLSHSIGRPTGRAGATYLEYNRIRYVKRALCAYRKQHRHVQQRRRRISEKLYRTSRPSKARACAI